MNRIEPLPQTPTATRKVGLLPTIGSVLAAFFGVQSSRVRVRDFSYGSPVLFFGVALALTAAFALTLIAVAQLLVRQAGVAG